MALHHVRDKKNIGGITLIKCLRELGGAPEGIDLKSCNVQVRKWVEEGVIKYVKPGLWLEPVEWSWDPEWITLH